MFQHVSANLCTSLGFGVCLCLFVFVRPRQRMTVGRTQAGGDGDQLWLGHLFQGPLRMEQAVLSMEKAA
ncbi:hypothetical protein LOAG_11690 [Loa loa]|uniref:Uncharacterized protein n=1 Tax=Loa loa TaxID=7209 RepID=A0A1S0TML4_LOALO|nr:hypothetical protein LOAG_11690 [Loa loa]EFO16815.2 hypothetical protein LOAG_11690 [Loa loa]